MPELVVIFDGQQVVNIARTIQTNGAKKHYRYKDYVTLKI